LDLAVVAVVVMQKKDALQVMLERLILVVAAVEQRMLQVAPVVQELLS
jgi:hypothetical protein